ncbi:MAG: pyruvate formate lyase activating enzyme [Candidatus Atribacteria bacterium]|nr:pyruvate formate lyase activating enzyme [Candidatus Atribacteria bacterium]
MLTELNMFKKGEDFSMKGVVFDIQRFSVHDGPGIRTTVFLKGCPLNCLWCHNPESQNSSIELGFTLEKCINCGTCEKVCPEGAVRMTVPERVDRTKCAVCGVCVDACPAGALEVVGKEMAIEEVIEEIEKDRVFYEESGGGVTISGGEPLSQFEFTLELSKRLKQNGFQVAIDTCGYSKGQSSDLKNLLLLTKAVNLILYDIKLIDNAKHKFYTGVSNETILDNAISLSSKFPNKILFRYPLITGVNDTEGDLRLLIEFLSKLSHPRIEVLSYHRLGVGKYPKVGKEYDLEHLSPPPEKEVEGLRRRLKHSVPSIEVC